MTIVSADRVASEWLRQAKAATSESTPKDVLKAFRKLRPQLEAAHRAGDLQESLRLWGQLDAKLTPLRAKIQGITRSDEAKRLKNLTHWQHRITYPFKPSHLSGPAEEVLLWIWTSLDTIDEALTSMARAGDRLSGYQQIEAEFRHGPFRVINKHGFRQTEYQPVLDTLDQTAEVIKRGGLGQVLYGDLLLESRKGAAPGRYLIPSDLVVLNCESDRLCPENA